MEDISKKGVRVMYDNPYENLISNKFPHEVAKADFILYCQHERKMLESLHIGLNEWICDRGIKRRYVRDKAILLKRHDDFFCRKCFEVQLKFILIEKSLRFGKRRLFSCRYDFKTI